MEQFVAPKPESVAAVTKWLSAHNVSAEVASPSGNMLRVVLSVRTAEHLLDGQFFEYLHPETNTTMIRTLGYSVPAEVAEHLTFIYPTTQYVPWL